MKDAYYFKHDCNARHDAKLVALRALFGMAGIGRWWCIVEILREQSGYTLDISNKYNRAALQRELEFTESEAFDEFLRELLELGLLQSENGSIFSVALMRRMQQLENIREKRSAAGKLGGRPPTKQNESKMKANGKQNESKPKANQKHLPTYLSTYLSTYGQAVYNASHNEEEGREERSLFIEQQFCDIPIETHFTMTHNHPQHGKWFRKIADNMIEDGEQTFEIQEQALSTIVLTFAP